jgi:hypothetical protein
MENCTVNSNYSHLLTLVQIAGCGRLINSNSVGQRSYQLRGAEFSFDIVLAKDSRYLERYALSLVKWFSAHRRIVMPSFSESSFFIFLGPLFCENKDNILIRNYGNNLLKNTASLTKRPEASSAPMWEPAATKYLHWLRSCPPSTKIRKEALLSIICSQTSVMCFIRGPKPDYNKVITGWKPCSQMCVHHLKNDQYVQNTSIDQKIGLHSVQLSLRGLRWYRLCQGEFVAHRLSSVSSVEAISWMLQM